MDRSITTITRHHIGVRVLRKDPARENRRIDERLTLVIPVSEGGAWFDRNKKAEELEPLGFCESISQQSSERNRLRGRIRGMKGGAAGLADQLDA